MIWAQASSSCVISFTHSALMLAVRMTLAHFSVSSEIVFPKSVADPGSVVAPRSAKRVLSLGSASPAFMTTLSFSIKSIGVFLV